VGVREKIKRVIYPALLVEEKGKFKVNNVYKNGGKNMNLINGMQVLKDEIVSSRGGRKQDIKVIKQDTRRLGQDTHKMIANSEKNRREQAKEEKRKRVAFAGELADSTKDLGEKVAVLRKGFRRDQKELKEEILTAGEVWAGTVSTKIVPEKENKKNEENEK